MTSLAWLFVGLVVIPTTAWIALAVHYHSRQFWLRMLASYVPLAVVGASLLWLPLVPWALAVWLGMVIMTIAWWLSLRPRGDRDWVPGLDVLPQVEVSGDTLRIRQFRNFTHSAGSDPVQRYEERTFDLARLTSVDYFLSHWSGPVMAHTLVSFGFDDGKFLALSVEARRQRWQRYSPLWGLFRAYELTYVLGDERDIVRLRTNIRCERVYMYRVRMPLPKVRRLLDDYLARIQRLASRPEWYNSVTSNCTTNLFNHGTTRVSWWVKPSIFLNGLSARAMYRLGALANSLPFRELQTRSAIRELALAAGDGEDFSQRIRARMVLPTPAAPEVPTSGAAIIPGDL